MSKFAKIAAEVASTLKMAAAADKDAEWQRVNSYIADVLKDSHVLYAKLARLQGDFVGEEFDRLAKISEAVLHIGDELSGFSKAFYDGKYDMAQSEFSYGGEGGMQSQQQHQQQPQQPAPAPAPAPAPEAAPAPAQGGQGGQEPMAFGDSGSKDEEGEGEPPAEDYSGEESEDEQ